MIYLAHVHNANILVYQDDPDEEIAVVYDPAFKYGQNFYLCVTEEAKKRAITEPEERASRAG